MNTYSLELNMMPQVDRQKTIFTEPLPTVIGAISEALKSRMIVPSWTQFVKTSSGCESIPLDSDWWFVRSASILQKIARKNYIGQRRLSREYSRSKNRGLRSNESRPGSRKIIRVILQDLEHLGFLEPLISNRGVVLGRRVTSQGDSFINSCLRGL